MDKHEIVASSKEEAERWMALIDRTNKAAPAPADMQAARELLDQVPEMAEVVFSLARVTRERMINAATSKALTRECMDREYLAARAGLGYEEAPPLEQLLIEQVAMCWWRLHLVEQEYTAHVCEPQSVALQSVEHWERRITLVHARFARACETLARVRRLAVVPALPAAREEGLPGLTPQEQARLIGGMAADALREARAKSAAAQNGNSNGNGAHAHVHH